MNSKTELKALRIYYSLQDNNKLELAEKVRYKYNLFNSNNDFNIGLSMLYLSKNKNPKN